MLPPISEDRILKAGARIRGDTGVASDAMRPRHVVHLSTWARRALAFIMMTLEKYRRWPETLRWVIELAIPKKTGGSRMIGLATAVYRLWTKIRYADCRQVLENRLARSYLPAAPGRGAERAAFDIAFEAEAAAASGDVVAATCIDLRQYFEQVQMTEVATCARRLGIP